MARNLHVPTEETIAIVRDYAAHGVPNYQIAAKIGIDANTLIRHYQDHIATGNADISRKVGAKLLELALEGNAQVLIFWAKSRMGWTDVQQLDKEDPQKIIELLLKAIDSVERDVRSTT